MEDYKKKWADNTVIDIKNSILNKKVYKTGDLFRSINYNITNEDISFYMISYGKFVDQGTRYISPRYFFKKVIERNIVDLKDAILNPLKDEILIELKNNK